MVKCHNSQPFLAEADQPSVEVTLATDCFLCVQVVKQFQVSNLFQLFLLTLLTFQFKVHIMKS